MRGFFQWRRARSGAGGELRSDLAAKLACPITGAPLVHVPAERRLRATGSGRCYPVSNGIPLLLAPQARRKEGRAEAPALSADGGDPALFSARYDAMIASPRMRAVYGDSGYFNVGYWTAATPDLAAACEQLVDRIASAVPAGARSILDVGCGIGAATVRLQQSFPDALVIAANVSAEQLVEAKRRGAQACAAMDATRLALLPESVDAVVSIEAAQHFDTRLDFFSEALRVLRPGGVIAVADMLFTDPEPAGAWLLPAGNDIVSLPAYAEALERCGFEGVEVEDVTPVTWEPYCALLRDAYRDSPHVVPPLERSVAHYVLASARKPGAPGHRA
jgi:SAM-dependent methyltransferase/uncharacterized protein YbaR (Trm112 family)